jgi:hypothetical protein
VYDVFILHAQRSTQEAGLLPLEIFLAGDENKKKYKLAKWTILCQHTDQGGLGILDLNTKNIALLSNGYTN